MVEIHEKEGETITAWCNSQEEVSHGLICACTDGNIEGPQRKNFLVFSALSEEGIPLQRKENSTVEDLGISSSDAQGSHVHTKM